jgi:S-layer homology domain
MFPRPRRSRPLVLILAVVALATMAVSPVAAADPVQRTGGTPLPVKGADRTPAVFDVPSGIVGFKSYLGWVYDDDSIAVVGEVLNRSGLRRQQIDIKVTWYTSTDPNATELGFITDQVLLDGTADGGVGPFVVFDPAPPPGVGAFLVEIVSSTPTSTHPVGGLDISLGSSYVDSDFRYYPGTIHNPNTFAVDSVRAILTAYNSVGDVGEVMPYEVGAIAAGGSAGFLIGIAADFGPEFTPTKLTFVADGARSGQASSYVTSWSNYFDDIANSTFRGDIIWLAEQGITKGCGAGRYCPTADVRRDEMASFLARALELPVSPPAADAFTDDTGNTHEKNINLIAADKITTGCAPGLYCPADNVKRDQMASFLARAMGLPVSPPAPNAFTDDNGNTHEKNINLIAAAKVTTGCGGTKYCPTENVTRGQMAAFLRRAFP